MKRGSALDADKNVRHPQYQQQERHGHTHPPGKITQCQPDLAFVSA
jgi:hypothetical protein